MLSSDLSTVPVGSGIRAAIEAGRQPATHVPYVRRAKGHAISTGNRPERALCWQVRGKRPKKLKADTIRSTKSRPHNRK